MMMMIMVNGNIEVFETPMIASLFSCCMFPVWREAETIARVAQLYVDSCGSVFHVTVFEPEV